MPFSILKSTQVASPHLSKWHFLFDSFSNGNYYLRFAEISLFFLEGSLFLLKSSLIFRKRTDGSDIISVYYMKVTRYSLKLRFPFISMPQTSLTSAYTALQAN